MRDAAARVACSNNLRQIGLALENARDQRSTPAPAGASIPAPTFPAGTIPRTGLAPKERLSWLVALLPYLEQDSLYKRFDLTAPWDAGRNRQPAQQTVKVFLCPAGPDPAAPPTGAWTHYVGIAGVGPDAATLPVSDPCAGFFGYDRCITREDIKDGNSNTLVALETGIDNGPWAAGGPATVRGLDPGTRPYVGKGRPFGIDYGGRTLLRLSNVRANALMADGSVRTLSENLSAATLEAMATIAGDDAVGPHF